MDLDRSRALMKQLKRRRSIFWNNSGSCGKESRTNTRWCGNVNRCCVLTPREARVSPLIVHPYFAKLEKIPVRPEPWMGIRIFSIPGTMPYCAVSWLIWRARVWMSSSDERTLWRSSALPTG